jgi:DNA-binding transcriptional LysR family regulator
MNSTSWQWDDIRFFLAVSRAGSLSGAARRLGVGHVTVGRRVASLELRLGVKLLSRTPDGFVPTATGEAVLKRCAAMEEAALDLERMAAGRDARAAGSLRLTATEGLAQRVVVPAVAALRRSHPDLRIDLAVGVRSLDISRRDADLAVRFARPTGAALVGRRLGEVGYALYAARAYLAARGVPTRGSGLAGHDLISFTGAPASTSPFFMGESLDGARLAVRCDNPLIQRDAAASGLGVAELACFLGDGSGDLVRLWPDELPVLRSAWLVVHEDLRRSARVKAMSAALLDQFRRQRKCLQQGERG